MAEGGGAAAATAAAAARPLCALGAQTPDRQGIVVTLGSPHIRIRDVVVGGRQG